MKQWTGLVLCVAAASVSVLLAQTTRSDRDLLTDALALMAQVKDTSSEWTAAQRTAFRNAEAKIQTARDQRPTTPPPPPPPPALACAPSTQTVQTSSPATMRATGGTGTYAWNASGGTPSSGSAASFSTSYGSAGTKTVAVASGTQTATCKVVVTATQPPPPPPPTGTLLFHDGWENRTELGCTLNGILDGNGGRSMTSWEDFGPRFPDLCGGSEPDAQVINTDSVDGSRSLQVAQKPGQENGTDFRMGQTFANQSEFYSVFYVKYASNWIWSTADHKMMIVMGPDYAQNIYLNVRGQGNGTPGYVVVHDLPADTRFDSSVKQISVGVWHKMELHVVAGVHGKIEVKVDDVPTAFPVTNEVGLKITDTNTGPSFISAKIDTTYNDGASIKGIMHQWFDNVSFYSGKGSF